MHYIRGFLPLFTYSTLAAQLDWRYSALITFAVAAALLLWDRWHRRPFDAALLQFSAAVFFCLFTIYAFADPRSPARDYGVALLAAWLALTAWGSLAARHPFTLGMAKQMADPEHWSNPRFIRVNVVLTTVWAASFTIAAFALSAVHVYLSGSIAAQIIVRVVIWSVPVTFTLAYPAVLRARAPRAAGEQP